jgi:hypothetical protein
MLLGLDVFNSFIVDNKIKTDLKDDFKESLLDLEKRVSSLRNSIEIINIIDVLKEVESEIYKEANDVKALINKVASVASCHLNIVKFKTGLSFNLTRYKEKNNRLNILKTIPNITVSLENISLKITEGTHLKALLNYKREGHSLRELCSNIKYLSDEQLPESVAIAEMLIESLKDKDKTGKLADYCLASVPRLQNLVIIMDYLGIGEFQMGIGEASELAEPMKVAEIFVEMLNGGNFNHFIKFCSETPSRLQALFTIVHYLGLNDLRYGNLEPFDTIFPNISVNQAPEAIFILDLSHKNVSEVNFSKFKFLKSLYLVGAEGLTAEKFNTIPVKVRSSIEDIFLVGIDVTGFDFSGFKGLKVLNFNESKGLTAEQFNAIPQEVKASIGELSLSCMDVTGFDFSGFTSLSVLDLRLTHEPLNINKASIRALVKVFF